MLPHNVYQVEAMERQNRDRIQNEAENARRLRNLAVKEAVFKEDRPRKPVIDLGWLLWARA
jgi:hypothetical protein